MQPFDNCLPVLGLNTTPYPFPYSLQLLSNQVLVQSPRISRFSNTATRTNIHSKTTPKYYSKQKRPALHFPHPENPFFFTFLFRQNDPHKSTLRPWRKDCLSPSANCRDSPSLKHLGDGLEMLASEDLFLVGPVTCCKRLCQTVNAAYSTYLACIIVRNPSRLKTYMHSSHNHAMPSSTPTGGQTCLPNNLFDTCHAFQSSFSPRIPRLKLTISS
ncbi:hypothetical protein CI102_12342 [Trichoderma harzianum]|uniref:Uncharacterized protein n=1 Tax=Trichoderma harzianum CBS 226.95 TaxID=983964 RepID=A0A2T4A341_TRIHA|nr:hypothetical protein M431DRAFT_241694 [Trichoderma harzianum CBS 226.95]PKK41797.1 hypothetical protein CI102_12342 [Trichoderma harzianum]PTB51393.1 hypothetical protein M431DRAFT_241694 [Trichoderma harzianum CBS 226.95]